MNPFSAVWHSVQSAKEMVEGNEQKAVAEGLKAFAACTPVGFVAHFGLNKAIDGAILDSASDIEHAAMHWVKNEVTNSDFDDTVDFAQETGSNVVDVAHQVASEGVGGTLVSGATEYADQASDIVAEIVSGVTELFS